MVKPTLHPIAAHDTQGTTLWVVFSDKTDIRFLKILRSGFRHCFVIMQQNGQWIIIDPRADKTDVTLLPHPKHFNLPLHFINDGCTVVKIPPITTPSKIAPIFPLSCVETVKRVIGLHRRWVVTPFQLYRTLNTLQKGS